MSTSETAARWQHQQRLINCRKKHSVATSGGDHWYKNNACLKKHEPHYCSLVVNNCWDSAVDHFFCVQFNNSSQRFVWSEIFRKHNMKILIVTVSKRKSFPSKSTLCSSASSESVLKLLFVKFETWFHQKNKKLSAVKFFLSFVRHSLLGFLKAFLRSRLFLTFMKQRLR